MRFPDRSAALVVAALVLVMMIAAAVLHSSIASRPGTMNVDRAVFASVNAGTLTGFQLPINPDDLKGPGQIMITVLMVGGTLTALIVGGWGLVRLLNLPFSDQQIVQSSLTIYVAVVLVGATALMRQGVEVAAATFQAASAFGNSGLVLGRLCTTLDWRTHVIVLPLALLGGLGIPVLMDVGSSITQLRRPHSHTIAVLSSTAGIYLMGVMLIVLLECIAGSNLREGAVRGSTEMLNSRSLGMPFDSFTALTRASQWIVLMAMAIGASPGGTGGGIKGTTLLVIGRSTRRGLAGQPLERIFAVAMAWFMLYFVLTLATTIGLLVTEPQLTADRVLFVSISALSNCGTSQEPLAITGAGLYILSLTMLAGRLLPLAILWWAARNIPETDLAVG
jgi:trk system potassium uptake protein TrkH